MRTCKGCREEKPNESFNKDPDRKDGLESRCKACTREYFRNYYHKNKIKPSEDMKLARRLSVYGLTIDQFDEMMLNQGGMCAICDRERNLHIDHDHITGKVRSLLCMPCNQAIGALQDSAERMLKAAEYIKKHSAT